MKPWLPVGVLALVLLAGCSSDRAGPDADVPDADPAYDPLDPTLAHAPDGTLAQRPWDAPRFAAPVRMNDSFGAARETSLAVGPEGSGLLLACDPSGVPNVDGGQSYFYLSSDDGQSFRDLDVEVDSTDLRQAAFEGGDCDTAIGPDGTLWSADTWLGSLSVGRSRDGGVSWTGTSLAGSAPGVDRPWLVTDGAGTLHLTYQDVQALMPSAIWYTRVVAGEGALVFQPAVPVTGANPDGAFTWTGNLVVSDDGGQLWSVYTRRAGPVTSDLEGSGPENVYVARSLDGGLTWTSVLVSARPAPASFLYPSIGQDAGGLLHVVFAQKTATAHPVFHSVSVDDGATWSEPAIVRDGVSAYSPWVAGGAMGQAAIQWYGSPDPQADPADNQTAWTTFWATVTGAGTPQVEYRSGTTTVEPMFVGEQGETPEFNMVRLDATGHLRLGLSVRDQGEDEAFPHWTAVYQAQVAGPTV